MEKYQHTRQKPPKADLNRDIHVITRLADIKLLFAECLIQNNKIGDALTQINDVRDRVGAELYLIWEIKPGHEHP